MPMFKDVFYWDDWADLDTFEVYFDCEVTRDIGDDIKGGDEFEMVYFHKDTLRLYFHKNKDDQEPAFVKKFVLC